MTKEKKTKPKENDDWPEGPHQARRPEPAMAARPWREPPLKARGRPKKAEDEEDA
jgi:hypothetical protein